MKLRKIISILLLVCMLMSLCSLSAFAADGEGSGDSGDSGDNNNFGVGLSLENSSNIVLDNSTSSTSSNDIAGFTLSIARTPADDVIDLIYGLMWLPDMQVDPGNAHQRSQVLGVWSAYLKLSAAEQQKIPDDLFDWLYYLVSNTDYAMIGGNGGWWYQGKKEGLSFSAIDPKQKFAAVYVDGEYVPYTNYSYYWYGENSFGFEDIVVVTLKPSYLATLGIGEHSITISYPNGYAPGYFYIVDSTAPSPPTGDTAKLPLWSGLMLISMAAAGSAGCMLRKKKKE